MWIKAYQNEQYAGVRGQDLHFAPGVNVILGDNEAGKSTLLTGIYDTLTKGYKIDGRREKAFLASRFPSGGANSIDGTVKLEIGGRQVTVKKEWDRSGADSRAVLYIDGERSTGAAAEAKLRELLHFSGAIYDNIVFGRQSNEQSVLEWLYAFLFDSAAQGADGAIAEARDQVSGALSAAGGISEDKFLEQLDRAIDALGAKWDAAADRPQNGRGLSNPWKSGAGEIVKAYYAYAEKQAAREAGAQALAQFAQNEGQLEAEKQQREALRQQQRALAAQKEDALRADGLKRELARCEAEGKELAQAAQLWPLRLEEQRQLEGLAAQLAEKQRRQARQAAEAGLARAGQLERELQGLEQAMEGLDDIARRAREARETAGRVQAWQGALHSGKLHAQVRLSPGQTAQLEWAGGRQTDLSGAVEVDLDGFVKITLPGLAEIVVAPQDIDVAGLQRSIGQGQQAVQDTLAQYQAADLAQLQAKADQYAEDRRAWERGQQELAQLPTAEYRAALAQNQTDPAMEVRPDLESYIKERLRPTGASSLEARLGALRQQTGGYADKYGTPEALAAQRESLAQTSAALRRQIEALPAGLPSAGEIQRQDAWYEEQIAAANRQIEVLSKALGSCDDIDLEALEQEAAQARAAWEHKKALHRSYCTIKADFEAIHSQEEGKYDGFFAALNENLSILAGGQLTASQQGQITSRGNPALSSQLLSQGTRQTVLLAFRLALLSYYYKEEGGVVVLDDVLLDMDPTRRANAARLIQQFAQTHQVLFTTCDPAIAALLGGHQIRL